jgi:hypothetical protein
MTLTADSDKTCCSVVTSWTAHLEESGIGGMSGWFSACGCCRAVRFRRRDAPGVSECALQSTLSSGVLPVFARKRLKTTRAMCRLSDRSARGPAVPSAKRR